MRPFSLPRVCAAFFIAAILCLSGGCDILRERPFEVVSWNPGAEYAPLTSSLVLRLLFSSEADRTSVEKYFSLTEDGTAVRGALIWENDRTLRFDPYGGFRENREYRAALGAEASSASGVSMDAAFDGRFATKASLGPRPTLLSISPLDLSVVEDARMPVALFFSNQVDIQACRDHVSFSPSVSGAWSIDESGRKALFSPAESWKDGTEYLVEVSADMIDVYRVRTGQKYRSRFQVGSDRTPPSLIGAYAVGTAGEVQASLSADDPADAGFIENPHWESSWRLRLDFSEEVDFANLDSRLSCESGPSLERETVGLSGSSAMYRLSEKPEWGSRFAFRLSSGVGDGRGNVSENSFLFRILANGGTSRPPRLIGMRLPLAPGAADEAAQELAAFAADDPFAPLAIAAGADRYPLSTATATRLELYFSLADGSSLDGFSLMKTFSMSATNSALSFSPRSVKTSDFRYAAPYAPWSAYARAEIEGYLTNQASSGVVSVTVDAGLADSLGNVRAEAMVLPLIK